MSLEDQALHLLARVLARDGADARARLADALRLLAKYRAESLQAALTPGEDHRVPRGPFAGMRFPPGSARTFELPKRLGIYESELHEVLATILGRPYRSVVNPGCAEGWYAVGLARGLPASRVLAIDTDARARAACARLAALNGVAARVEVRDALDAAALAALPGPLLVVCDIEGDEDRWLDPSAGPALASADVLVEVHDVFVPGTGERLASRFAASHRLRRIESGSARPAALPELAGRDQLEQLLARWEGRLAGTYWLWMEAVAGG